MADFQRVSFSMHHTRADLLETVIDMDHVREWARGKGYLPHVARYSNHLWEYLQDNPDVPRTVGEGELLLEECANLEAAYQHPATTEEIMELLHPDPWAVADRAKAEARANQEFADKRQSLAMFLLALATGMTWEDAEGAESYHENYTKDADNILRAHPHLLGLDAREAKGL